MAFKKKNHKCKKEIGFIWIDGDFFNYSFEEEIKNYPYTLSVFEMEESSFDINVMNVFVEIMDILTKGKRVLHIVDGYTLQISLTDIKEMLQQQINTYGGWDKTELLCLLNENRVMQGKFNYDIYFMIDMLRANMTIKCLDENVFIRVKKCIETVIASKGYSLIKDNFI